MYEPDDNSNCGFFALWNAFGRKLADRHCAQVYMERRPREVAKWFPYGVTCPCPLDLALPFDFIMKICMNAAASEADVVRLQYSAMTMYDSKFTDFVQREIDRKCDVFIVLFQWQDTQRPDLNFGRHAIVCDFVRMLVRDSSCAVPSRLTVAGLAYLTEEWRPGDSGLRHFITKVYRQDVLWQVTGVPSALTKN